jgi:hypothetical protein
MILFSLSQTSIDESISYIDHVKERILVGIRLGMRDGVRGLRDAEVEASADHPSDPRNKPNDLLANILGRAGRVIETDTEITAIYKPRNAGKQPHYWLEYGVTIPAVEDTLMAMSVEGGVIFRRAHKEFAEAAKPFIIATGEGYQGEFLEHVETRVDEALHA